MSPEAKHFYAFGPFRLDSEKRVLVRDGTPVPLTPKAAETLLLLVKNAGYLVHKDELMAQVWPEAFVEEGNLNKNIFVLRRVLGERDGQQEYIETVPKRGYRFVAPVEEVTHAEAPQQSKGPSAPSLIGQKVSHYRVLDVIGGGGMGMVYRAEDLKLGREVALKFLPPELASDSVALQRFEREARAASSLDHSNICTVYEVEEHDGQPFIVMQLLQGETLRDRLSVLASKQEKMMIDELLRIAIQTCDGLEVAHARGIVHRDIKPANIFLTAAGQVKILDFGLAKVVQVPGLSPMKGGEIEDPDFRSANGDERKIGVQTARPGDAALTQFGVAMGTAGYMSPEQIRGEPLDARTDIFSFGLVLYEMATGKRAFVGETAGVVRDAIVSRTPIPIHDLNSAVPPKLEALIVKALEKDRERRYQSAAEMLADLEQVKTKPPARMSVRWKWYTAAALLAVMTGGALYWRSHQRIKITPKDTIVVAHFVNSTGDPAMDGGALDWPLARELQESPYLTVLYPSKVFDTVKLLGVSEPSAWYGPWGPKLTPELARQVCLRSDSRAYITASIANAGNAYHILLHALDCHSGTGLANVERETTDRNQIIKTLGIAGHQLRRELGEPEDSLRRFNTPLDQETSWSLEALQAHDQAWRLRAEQGDAAALPQYKRAVELDPNLANAYLNLAGIYMEYGDNTLKTGYANTALKLSERLSPRSRWYTEAVYYTLTGELDKASATYAEWEQTFPADPVLHQNFASCLTMMGQPERAVAEGREAVRLTPKRETYSNFLHPLIEMNRLEEAKAVYDEARARGIDELNLRDRRYAVAFLENDSAAMQEQLSWGMERSEAKAWAFQQMGDSAAYHGRFRVARGFYSQMSSDSPDSIATFLRQQMLAYVALSDVETGNPVRARQRSAEVPDAASMRTSMGLIFARVGDVNRAEDLVKLIDQESPLGTLVQKYELPSIRAAVELDKGHPEQALEILQPTLPYDLARPEAFPQLYPVYLRGLAYLELGKGREAATEFQKIIDHRGVVADLITGPLSYLQLARAQAMMGDKDAARKSYQGFLRLWKEADPEIPIYRQAKAEYAKLQ